MVGGGGGWDLFFLNFLRALLEASPKSDAGSNLGAPRGPKTPPRAQSLQKQNLEPGSLDCAPEMQGLGGGGGGAGPAGGGGALGPGLLLWAVTLSFLRLCCTVSIPLTNDKGDAEVGEVTQRHTASRGAESPEKNRAVLSWRMPLRRIFYTVLVTYIYLARLC